MDNLPKTGNDKSPSIPGRLGKVTGMAGKGGVIMAVRNAYRRIQKWEANLSGEALSEKVGRLKDMMKSQIEELFPALVSMEDRVKTVLDEEGISTTQYPFYLNFGRQCFKLVRQFAGATLINRANIV
ncbi:MAG: hypothetical protein KIH08_16895, partial [Candidatus Freyarchaeota archaeon]|nr:hypothetical protein [Candidatus Jordarchaeia archaeon]